MELFQKKREVAHRQIKTADHLLLQSYPLLKDTRLLLAVLKHLFIASENIIDSLLEHEHLFCRPACRIAARAIMEPIFEVESTKYSVKAESRTLLFLYLRL